MKGRKTVTGIECAGRKKTTEREKFLSKMDEILPWDRWVKMIEPYYPSGKRGRPVRGIETMLRMYLIQTWFNFSDGDIEDAIYDSYAMRKFFSINFMDEQVPDAATLPEFRQLLEKYGIEKAIFEDIRQQLKESGLIMRGGAIADAAVVSAPGSAKNSTDERDPETRQTKKGNP